MNKKTKPKAEALEVKDESDIFTDDDMDGVENINTNIQDVDDFPDVDDLNAVDESLNHEVCNSVEYDKAIILPSRGLLDFLRLVEQRTKVSIDYYGKCVQIKSIDENTVKVSYINGSLRIEKVFENPTNKTVKTFWITVANLRKIVQESLDSVLFVEKNGGMNINILSQLLFIETIELNEAEYEFPSYEESKESFISVDKAKVVFSQMAFVLNMADRVVDKMMVVLDDKCYYNTAVCSVCMDSPFKDKINCFLYKPVVELLGSIAESTKLDFVYKTFMYDDMQFMEVNVDGTLRAMFQINTSENVSAFKATIQDKFDFEETHNVINDSISRIVSIANSFTYLSNVVQFETKKDELTLVIYSNDLNKKSKYIYKTDAKSLPKDWSIKVSATALNPLFKAVGTQVKYTFNQLGLGITTEYGKVLFLQRI